MEAQKPRVLMVDEVEDFETICVAVSADQSHRGNRLTSKDDYWNATVKGSPKSPINGESGPPIDCTIM